MGLGWSVLGDNTRTRLKTSVLDKPRKGPGRRPMLGGNRRLGLRHVYNLVGQCQGILSQGKVDVWNSNS